jgi:hypothetical protein
VTACARNVPLFVPSDAIAADYRMIYEFCVTPYEFSVCLTGSESGDCLGGAFNQQGLTIRVVSHPRL